MSSLIIKIIRLISKECKHVLLFDVFDGCTLVPLKK